jgi:uncharacterized protein
MFHAYLTLIYFLSNIYVYFRIRNLFISKSYRLWFTLIYIIFIVLLPDIALYAHIDKSLPGKIISAFSFYILPLYLYIFLLLLLFEPFLIINRLTKLVPRETMQSFRFRSRFLTCILGISAAIVLYGVINLNTIQTSPYRIEVPRRDSGADHLRIAFASDFHIKTNTPMRFMNQFVKKMNDLNPDLILFGGDLLEGERITGTDEKFESAFRRMHARLGVYGVLGNHEFYARQEKGGFFRKAGITLLRDSVVKIENAFYLAGRYDDIYSGRKTVAGILAFAPENLPVILMDHRPSGIPETSLTKVDVQFSGHTHNGQLFPINLILRQLYELSWGYRKIGNTHFFVSSGVRLWGPPVKTSGKAEIMVVDIIFR